jgi:hypothetical protein
MAFSCFLRMHYFVPAVVSCGYRARHDSATDGPVVAAVVIGGVFLLGMAAAAVYAAHTLPAGARVPFNPGMPEYSIWLSKPAGLAAWLGVGVAAFAVFAALTLSSLTADWAQSLRFVLLPSVMLVVLAAEAGAVIVARRCAAGQPVVFTAVAQDGQPSGSDGVALCCRRR